MLSNFLSFGAQTHPTIAPISNPLNKYNYREHQGICWRYHTYNKPTSGILLPARVHIIFSHCLASRISSHMGVVISHGCRAIGRLCANRPVELIRIIPHRPTYFCNRFPSRISYHMGVMISHGCNDWSPLHQQTSGSYTFTPHRPTYCCNQFPSRISYQPPLAPPIFATDFNVLENSVYMVSFFFPLSIECLNIVTFEQCQKIYVVRIPCVVDTGSVVHSHRLTG